MGEVIANAPTAGNKARAGLSKEESARFFGPPPLIAGENRVQFEAMRDQISAAVGPRDFLEEILVNDVVNLVWETLRLRRLRAALLQAAAPEGVDHILNQTIAIDWASRQPRVVAKGDAALYAAGLTMDVVMAQTLALKIDEFERIDRMGAGAEARRNSALREIDRHRAAALRQAADEVLDAEFKEIPPSLSEGEAA
jgi:hypothetical protein